MDSRRGMGGPFLFIHIYKTRPLTNCMCELSKYTKARRGTGRPRNKYKPFEEPSALDEFL